METIGIEIGKFLLTQGWAGIIILSMGGVIWHQKSYIKELHDRNTLLQDLRVQDAKDLTEKTITTIETTRAAVQGFTEAIRHRK